MVKRDVKRKYIDDNEDPLPPEARVTLLPVHGQAPRDNFLKKVKMKFKVHLRRSHLRLP